MDGRGEVGTLGALWITWILVGGGIIRMFPFSLERVDPTDSGYVLSGWRATCRRPSCSSSTARSSPGP